jgi:hypothetical protein
MRVSGNFAINKLYHTLVCQVPKIELAMTIPKRDPEPWLEIAKEKLAQQLANIDAIDAKVGTFLATGSALLGLLVAVFALRPPAVGSPQTGLLVASFVAYAILAIGFGVAILPRTWGVGPDLDKEWRLHRGISEHELKWRFASRYQKDFRTNKGTLGLKRAGLKISAIALTVETVLVAVGLFSIARPC